MSKFTSLPAILSYYTHNNPSRAKSINLLEPDRGSSSNGEDAVERWTYVCATIHHVMKEFRSEPRKELAFRIWYLTPRESEMRQRLTKKEIAQKLRVSVDTIRRWHNEVFDELERTFRAAGDLE